MNILSRFPKTRPPLPPGYTDVWEKLMKTNREGRGPASKASQLLETWLHSQVAKDTAQNLTTLELGAGTLNQLDYEKAETYDVIEPFKALYENSEHLSRIRKVYDLIEEVPLENRYSRIISSAVLEHVDNLPFVVAKSALLLNENGCFRASVPNEGGLLWGAAWRFTTGLEYRVKFKIDYSKFAKHEHINSVDEIQTILKVFFRKVSIKRLGLGRHFSFYTFFCAKEPIIERCKEMGDYFSWNYETV